MKPPPFDYVAPTSIDEALEHLSRGGEDARPLAGGQSLVPMLALRLARPSLLVDLNRVTGLAGISHAAGELRIGAMTRQRLILADSLVGRHAPALADATRFVGHEQTRNRGTIGGSISLADPQSEYPAVALALGARIEARSPAGTRRILAEKFFLSPYSTALDRGEIVTALIFPDWGDGTLMHVDEVARRPGDFAMVGLVAALRCDAAGKISRAGLAWFGMAPTPRRAVRAEAALTGAFVSGIDVDAIGHLAVEDTEPWDDVHASAAYRRTVGARVAARSLRRILNASSRGGPA